MERNMVKGTILRVILAVILLSSVQSSVTAQEYISTPVTISNEKVRVNGKVCYSHVVREKQTLYSIAKAYKVSVDDIYSLNPSLKEEGLKKNSIILIPAEAAPARQEVPAKEPEVKETPVVRETPAVQEAPEKENSVEETPAKEKKESKKESRKKQKTHTVKWYEDLDVIADKYGVSVEAIMNANGLTGRKLSKRQKLIIPEPGETVPAPEIIPDAPAAEEEAAAEETPVEETVQTDTLLTVEDPWIFTPKNEVQATLILPMKASTDNVSRNNMDFYSGVLLAVRDMAESGISTELNVYDSSDSSHPISSEDLDGSDIVIGPVSSGDLQRLLDTDRNPQMVISPLDPRAETLAYGHSNFIQVPTPQTVLYQDLVNWIREDTMPGDTLLIISEKGARQTDAVVQMTLAADSSGMTFIPFSYSILEGRDITEPLTNLMTATGTNRVLIASDSEAFVNDVVRNLNILVYNKLNVVLYAPARIRNFETIEVENLHNTSLHVSLGYLIDYDSQQVKNFLLKYRALFNTEPTQYAFQGYDIATYFIGMCSRYGSGWTRKLGDTESKMLQSTFRYVPVENGGYVNNGVRRLVYGPGWSVLHTR